MRKLKSMVRGFTLVELLIVLAVIAALLAIVTPFALGAVRQANATRIAATMRNIATVGEAWILAEKPTSSDSLSDFINKLVEDGYLNRDPGENFTATASPTGGWTNVSKIELIVSFTSDDENLLKAVEKTLKTSFGEDSIKLNEDEKSVKLTYKISKWW